MSINLFLQGLWLEFGSQIVVILALIAGDLLLAVAAAIKVGMFQWAEIAGFFQTQVIPKLMGWVVLAAMTKAIPPGMFGTIDLGGVTATAAFALVVASLVGSIVGHLRTIGLLGSPESKANHAAEKVGL